MPVVKIVDSDIRLSGRVSRSEIEGAFKGRQVYNATFRDFRFIDVEIANLVMSCASLRSVEVWSGMSRSALSRILMTPGLSDVTVFQFRGSGRFRNFERATEVRSFRGWDLRNPDFIEIAKLPKLQRLVAQFMDINLGSIQRLRNIETLLDVEFEGVSFSESMAHELSKSKSIINVGLAATSLSRRGLMAICQMSQMKHLDIWGNGLTAEDLVILAGHPNLEKLELGGFGVAGAPRLRASEIISRLEKIPSLTTVCFENVITTEEEQAYLAGRYDFRLLNEDL